MRLQGKKIENRIGKQNTQFSAMKHLPLIHSLLILNTVPICLAEPSTPTEAYTPAQHEAAYQQFVKMLETIAVADSPDIVPAIVIAIEATGDELCVDEWMKRAANDGNPVAQLYLSSTSLNFVPQNQQQAAKVKNAVAMVKKAADAGYAPAMITYSSILRTGSFIPADEVKANQLIMEACKSGNYETRFSWLLQTDRLMKYEDKERPEVKAEIARGNHHVVYYLSQKAPDAFVSLLTLTEAARMGNPSAMYELSAILLQLKNPKVSYYYLKQAAELHHPMALTILGEYMISGNKELEECIGLKKDPAAGIYMLKIASMMGNTRAQAILSHIYFHGLFGVPKDEAKAYRHVEIGETVVPDVGYITAKGYMLLTGSGVKQDTAQGIALIEKAARTGFPHAVFMLANVYYNGIGGITKNGSEAVYLLESMATQRGLEISFIFLAYIYEKGGAGIEPDPKRVQYYLDHAQRAFGQAALTKFEELKNDENGWIVTPFNIKL